MSTAAAGSTVHATAIVIGADGILIRGEAGAGKSSLARELMAWAEGAGRYGALVADDRVLLSPTNGRVIARAVPPVEGLIEIRGVGLVRVPHEPATILRLVVDLTRDPPRMSDEAALNAVVACVSLPRIVVNRALAPGVVVWRLGHLRDRFVTVP